MTDLATTPRKSYHFGNLRTALIEVATAMIERDGLNGFSLRACARELEVDPAAAYRHFRSKESLLNAVISQAWTAMAERMRTEVKKRRKGLAIDQMIAVGNSYVGFAVEHPTLYEAIFSLRAQRNNNRKTGEHQTSNEEISGASAYDILTQSLDNLVTDKTITRSQRENAEAVAWSAVHGLATLINQGLLELEPSQRKALVEKTCRTIVAGLSNT